MAVTVTPAAPPTSTDKAFIGPYGASGSSVFVTANSEVFAGKRVKVSKLTLSGTYLTGGFTISASTFGLKEIHLLCVLCDGASGGAATPALTTAGATATIKLYVDNVPTELTNTTSVTNHQYDVFIVGV